MRCLRSEKIELAGHDAWGDRAPHPDQVPLGGFDESWFESQPGPAGARQESERCFRGKGLSPFGLFEEVREVAKNAGAPFLLEA